MISYKAKAAALKLQGALGGKDGLLINDSIIELAVELGGSAVITKALVSPIAQMVYLFTLMVQHMPSLHVAEPISDELPG